MSSDSVSKSKGCCTKCTPKTNAQVHTVKNHSYFCRDSQGCFGMPRKEDGNTEKNKHRVLVSFVEDCRSAAPLPQSLRMTATVANALRVPESDEKRGQTITHRHEWTDTQANTRTYTQTHTHTHKSCTYVLKTIKSPTIFSLLFRLSSFFRLLRSLRRCFSLSFFSSC